LLAWAAPAIAQSTSSAAAKRATFELVPHCDTSSDETTVFGPLPNVDFFAGKPVRGACESFTVNGDTIETANLKEGDTLDLDLLLRNPDLLPIQRVRVWIAYDPTVLSGALLQINPAFPTVTASERGFSKIDGYAKIAARTNDNAPVATSLVHVARLQLKVLSTKTSSTALSFYNAKGETKDNTVAVVGKGKDEVAVLSTTLQSLLVRLSSDGASSSSATSVSSASTTSSSSSTSSSSTSSTTSRSSTSSSRSSSSSLTILTLSSSSTTSSASSVTSSAMSTGPLTSRAPGAFGQLQVAGLGLTTQGASVSLAWQALRSSEVTGYNVYYGTTPGLYTQRRTLVATATSDVLGNLTPGQRYYFAVRALSAAGESDYSQEVSVIVGQANTATSTLTAAVVPPPVQTPPNVTTTPTPYVGPRVVGQTGPTTWLLFALLGSIASLSVFQLTRRTSSFLA
jgi:hypothetical protein